MIVAYYARAATQAFWAEHWGAHSPEALTRVAETSPLTDMLFRQLPPPGTRVLEGGCGLGQYVVLLRRAGYAAVGADWTVDPLRVCRAWAKDTPLVAMDLAHLAFPAETFAAYVSLGVVEHDPGGPDGILNEAYRVVAPGGTLLVSVPYVNLVRRLTARRIRRANERIRAAGGTFYQFAFSQREVARAVERAGFRVVRATPYDPARILRSAWRRVRPATPASAIVGDPGLSRQRSRVLRLGRRLLNTAPALRVLGHMILLTAVKR